MELKVRAPAHAFDFEESDLRRLAVLGETVTYLASYEFACDEFIFTVAEHEPRFASQHKAPHNKDHLRRPFILSALKELPALANLQDANGSVDFAYIEKAMEMIWHHRNNINHGRIFASYAHPNGIQFKLTRWVRRGSKGEYSRITYEYDTELLKQVIAHASYIRAMLIEACEMIEMSHKIESKGEKIV